MKTPYYLIGKLVISTEAIFHTIRSVIAFWIYMDGQKNERLNEMLASKFSGKRSLQDLLNVGATIYGKDIFKISKIGDLKKAFYKIVEIRNNIVHGFLTLPDKNTGKIEIKCGKLNLKLIKREIIYSEKELMLLIKLCEAVVNDINTLELITIKKERPNQIKCSLELKIDISKYKLLF